MDDFLAQIGPEVGRGYQGGVFEFGKTGTKVVKKLNRFRKTGGEKKDLISEINVEIVNATFAGEMGVGPIIHSFRFLGDHVYIVMEKIVPYTPVETDLPRLKALFTTLIQIGLVNVDGGFGLRKDKLLLYDYGVSFIMPSPKKALQEYLDSEYFFLFEKNSRLTGLQDYFSSRKFTPSPKKKNSPSPRKSK